MFGAQRVVEAAIRTRDTNVIAVLFLATKHELARLWAVDSVFKTEGLSLAYRINLHPYDDEGPARGLGMARKGSVKRMNSASDLDLPQAKGNPRPTVGGEVKITFPR